MKKTFKLIPIILIACFCLVLSSCKLFTVVKIDKGNGNDNGTSLFSQDNSFDADKYVSSIWSSKVIPTMEKKSVDFTELLKALNTNVDEAGKKYGFRSSDDGSPWSFIVKGKAKITKVDQESLNGMLEVNVDPKDKTTKVIVQVGPVINGTSIRDSLDFIDFNNFTNQMDFASVSSAMNKYINKNVTDKLDYKKLNGKYIEFIGAFTLDTSKEITITPVMIKEAGGDK